jgi:hypothetical protein
VGGAPITGWLSDFTNALVRTTHVAHNEMGVVNSIGRFQIATASFRWDTKYSRSFTAPVHADGAGGLGMF